MHDELTRSDLEKMQEELDDRRINLRPKLLEAVKEARAFGDLSENFEYKAAKQEKNHNERRIRYLENMIKTAVVIEDQSEDNQVGLFDQVTVYFEEDDEEETFQRISKESPVGQALFGHRVGERVMVKVNENCSYPLVIRKIEKCAEDESVPINPF